MADTWTTQLDGTKCPDCGEDLTVAVRASTMSRQIPSRDDRRYTCPKGHDLDGWQPGDVR